MFNSKDVKTTGGIAKVINPGTVKVHLLDLILEQPSFGNGAYQLHLQLETSPILEEGFVGLQIDKNDPSRGNYSGQAARVKSQPYLFTDYEYNGNVTPKEQQVFRYLIKLADNIGKREMLDKVNASSIEEYVEKAKVVLCDRNNWFFATIGGEEYDNVASDGKVYTSYRLVIPKTKGRETAFSLNSEDPNFVMFNPELHIKKKKVAEAVAGFGSGSDDGFGASPSMAATPAVAPSVANPFASDLDL
jgi:hypothetical protein